MSKSELSFVAFSIIPGLERLKQVETNVGYDSEIQASQVYRVKLMLYKLIN